MALTQISTGGVKDNAVTAGKIPANAVGSSEIADDAVDQGAIADEAVDEARLQISNAGSNGQFLQKQSGNTGGLTWADGASEGTEVKSTGESGTTKFLRVDGDGTSSWQVPPDTVYTHPNHSGEVTSSADGAQTIASNVVDEDNLKISNSGTNGQFLQKQSGNTGGLTWADVSAAPEVELTASGSISNNQAVAVKSNGQVEAVTATTTFANPVTSSGFVQLADRSTQSTYWNDTTYDANTECLVMATTSGSNGIHIYVGTVTAGGISWGSKNSFNTSQAYREIKITADGNGKVALTAHEASTWGNIRLWIGTINSSSKTVSWGSDTNYGYAGTSGNHLSKPVWTTTNNLAIGRREQVSSDDMIVEVFSVSGTSITNNNTQYSVTQGEGPPSLAYRNGKLVYVGRRRGNNSLDIRVANVASNGTLTWGGLYNRTGIHPNMQAQSVTFVGHDERFLIAFRDNTAGRGFSRIYSWTGSGAPAVSVTGSDTYYTPSGTAGSNARVYYDDNLGRVVLAYREVVNGQQHGIIKTGAVSGTSITWDNSTTPLAVRNTTNNSDMEETMNLAHDTTRNRGILSSRGNSGSTTTNDYSSHFLDVSTTSTNGQSFIGFSKGAYTNGQTATIAVTGNTTTQSSLTPGSRYYIQKNGSLATTSDHTPNVDAGIALSSTKLLIKG